MDFRPHVSLSEEPAALLTLRDRRFLHARHNCAPSRESGNIPQPPLQGHCPWALESCIWKHQETALESTAVLGRMDRSGGSPKVGDERGRSRASWPPGRTPDPSLRMSLYLSLYPCVSVCIYNGDLRKLHGRTRTLPQTIQT